MSTILLPLPSEYTLRPFVRPSVHSFKLTCRYQMMLVFGVLWQPLGKTVNIWLLPLDQCGRVYSSSFSSCETLFRLVGSSFAFDLELRTFGVTKRISECVRVSVCVSLWSYCCRLVACTVFMLTSYFLVMEETPAWKWHLFGECLLLVLFVLFFGPKWIKTSEWMNEYPFIAAQEKFTAIFYVKNKRKCVQIQKQEQQRETSNKIKKQN